MLMCDLITQNAVTKQEVKDAVEKSGEWSGISMDYPGGIYYRYRIAKNGAEYVSEVSETNGIGMQASRTKDFESAFSLLESLQNHIDRYNNLGKLVKPEPIIIDAKTKVQVDYSKIQTQVINHDVWEGYIEWKPNVRSTIALFRDDKNGYSLVVKFGSMDLSGKCVSRISDVFGLLRDFNECIRNLIR